MIFHANFMSTDQTLSVSQFFNVINISSFIKFWPLCLPKLERDDSCLLQIMVKRQRTAFPPNFVHSLDGSHMMMTAIACKKAGLNFAGASSGFSFLSLPYSLFWILITIFDVWLQEFMILIGHMHVMWMKWTGYLEKSLFNSMKHQYWKMYGIFTFLKCSLQV